MLGEVDGEVEGEEDGLAEGLDIGSIKRYPLESSSVILKPSSCNIYEAIKVVPDKLYSLSRCLCFYNQQSLYFQKAQSQHHLMMNCQYQQCPKNWYLCYIFVKGLVIKLGNN